MASDLIRVGDVSPSRPVDNSQILNDWLSSRRSTAEDHGQTKPQQLEPYESPFSGQYRSPYKVSPFSQSARPDAEQPAAKGKLSTDQSPIAGENGTDTVPLTGKLGTKSLPTIGRTGIEPAPNIGGVRNEQQPSLSSQILNDSRGNAVTPGRWETSNHPSLNACGATVVGHVKDGAAHVAKPIWENLSGALILAVGVDLLIGKGKSLPITSNLLRGTADVGKNVLIAGSRGVAWGMGRGSNFAISRPLVATGTVLGVGSAWVGYDKLNECRK
jgi:hypothetical protein